jgi:hypothetical protein
MYAIYFPGFVPRLDMFVSFHMPLMKTRRRADRRNGVALVLCSGGAQFRSRPGLKFFMVFLSSSDICQEGIFIHSSVIYHVTQHNRREETGTGWRTLDAYYEVGAIGLCDLPDSHLKLCRSNPSVHFPCESFPNFSVLSVSITDPTLDRPDICH